MDYERSIPQTLPVGGTFHGGRYEIVRCLSAGGMGTVYEVIQVGTRRHRALKVMLPSLVADPELRARFRLEATITADIDSEHIVETIDADIDAETGAPFLVMELLRGEDMGTLIDRRGRLPPPEVLTLLFQVASGLDKTHARGIIHRDLKPENLFVVSREDGMPRVKILDFGVAKVVAQSARTGGTTRSLGSPLYMSPEQIQGTGTISSRADNYALGHIAFTLLVGSPYWEEESRASEGIYPFLLKVMSGTKLPATARAGAKGVVLPPAFDAWFARATALLPEGRFQHASELVAALAVALGAEDPAAAKVTRRIARSIGDSPPPSKANDVARATTPDRVFETSPSSRLQPSSLMHHGAAQARSPLERLHRQHPVMSGDTLTNTPRRHTNVGVARDSPPVAPVVPSTKHLMALGVSFFLAGIVVTIGFTALRSKDTRIGQTHETTSPAATTMSAAAGPLSIAAAPSVQPVEPTITLAESAVAPLPSASALSRSAARPRPATPRPSGTRAASDTAPVIPD